MGARECPVDNFKNILIQPSPSRQSKADSDPSPSAEQSQTSKKRAPHSLVRETTYVRAPPTSSIPILAVTVLITLPLRRSCAVCGLTESWFVRWQRSRSRVFALPARRQATRPTTILTVSNQCSDEDIVLLRCLV